MKSPIPLIDLYLRTEVNNNNGYAWTQKLTPNEWMDFQTNVKNYLRKRTDGELFLESRFESILRDIQGQYQEFCLDYNKMIISKKIFNMCRNDN